MKDRAWLEAHRLKVVIDFSRLINRSPDLTFASGVPHQYEESVRRFDAVLTKMGLLGSRDAIICSHASEKDKSGHGDDWDDQRVGIERFLDQAASHGITVHWRTSTMRPPGKLFAHAALCADLRRTHPDLRIAACAVDEMDVDRLKKALLPAGKPELWLLAAHQPEGGRNGVRFLPVSRLPKEKLTDLFSAAKDATVVFDADYLSWDETLIDFKHSR